MEVIGTILDWVGRITSLLVLILFVKGIISKLIPKKKDASEKGTSTDTAPATSGEEVKSIDAVLAVAADKDKDNRVAVKKYLEENNCTQWKMYDIIMQRSAMNENPFSADHYVSDLLEELQHTLKDMNKDKVTTVHLFYAGPGVLLAPIIAAFYNNIKCVLYDFDYKKGEYYRVEEPKHNTNASRSSNQKKRGK